MGRGTFAALSASLAILAAGAMIAAAIAFTNHWTIETSGGIAAIVRLDRWTGSLRICVLDSATMGGSTLAGTQMTCEHTLLQNSSVEPGPWTDYAPKAGEGDWVAVGRGAAETPIPTVTLPAAPPRNFITPSEGLNQAGRLPAPGLPAAPASK
jgi:hypothetical protein